jgi:hypothetical protein
VSHPFLPAFGQLHGSLAHIKDPTQYLLSLAPTPITFVKLFL